MTKPVWCHRSTMSCNGENCILYVAETDQCFDEIEKNHKLSQIRSGGTTQTPPPTPPPPPLLADAMKPDNPFPELKIGGFLPSISGRISSPLEVREVTAQGKPTTIAEFGFTDGVAVIKVTVWEPEDDFLTSNVGSGITLTKMSVREYKGEIQISTTRASKISR